MFFLIFREEFFSVNSIIFRATLLPMFLPCEAFSSKRVAFWNFGFDVSFKVLVSSEFFYSRFFYAYANRLPVSVNTTPTLTTQGFKNPGYQCLLCDHNAGQSLKKASSLTRDEKILKWSHCCEW